MSDVWDNSPYEHSLLLIHLSLADQANDEGYCWPAVKSIAKRCRLDERYTRRLLSQMVEDGFLEKNLNEGRKGTNVYLVRSKPVKKDPLVKKTGGENKQEGVVAPSPLSPRPPEPSVEPSGIKAKSFATLEESFGILKSRLDSSFSENSEFTEWWEAFFHHRSNLKSKLTPKAVELFAGFFKKLGPQNSIVSLQQSVRSGKWTDLYEPKSSSNGNHSHRSAQKPNGRIVGSYNEGTQYSDD